MPMKNRCCESSGVVCVVFEWAGIDADAEITNRIINAVNILICGLPRWAVSLFGLCATTTVEPSVIIKFVVLFPLSKKAFHSSHHHSIAAECWLLPAESILNSLSCSMHEIDCQTRVMGRGNESVWQRMSNLMFNTQNDSSDLNNYFRLYNDCMFAQLMDK